MADYLVKTLRSGETGAQVVGLFPAPPVLAVISIGRLLLHSHKYPLSSRLLPLEYIRLREEAILK